MLVIEPDNQLGETYHQALNGMGLTVRCVQDAQGALVELEKNKPKLITLEVQLPGHNGVELLHEMRSYSDWQAIPVLFLTVVSETELGINRTAWHNLKIAAYCYKPLTSLQQLTKTITDLMEHVS